MARLTPRKRYRRRHIRSPRKACSSHEVYIVILPENIPAPVERVRYYRNTQYPYAVCPNCKSVIERDYQNYCETCGQKLDWKMFGRKVSIEEYVDGPDSRRCMRKIFVKRKQRSLVVAESI